MSYQDDLANWELDGWSISKELFAFICENLEHGKTVLELGSGPGTNMLAKYFKVYSVENDPQWLNKYNSTYLHVPLKNLEQPLPGFPSDRYWYDGAVLEEKLKDIDYDLLLIDGPKAFRGNTINHLHLFNTDAMIIVDDVHRPGEMTLATKIGQKLGKSPVIHTSVGNSAFAVIK